jgi:predicted lipoprotein with Yx(FWY)xxD motif
MKLSANRVLAPLALAASIVGVFGVAHAASPAVEHGVLTGDHGMTLYTFDKDKAHSGKSECTGACATNWPPFLASASETASGDYGFVMRSGGKMQWAYKGKPLYFWHKDKKPGDETGAGFKHVWRVARG